MRLILTVLLASSFPQLLHSRIVASWTDQEIFDKADLVVIAKAVSSKDTAEHTQLTDISPPVNVIGVNTEFETCLVLKGKRDIAKFRLHHYRTNEGPFANGPSLIEFQPGGKSTYLLLLVKESDGQYAPAAGQSDPAGVSVIRLAGSTGPRTDPPEPEVSCQQRNVPEPLHNLRVPTYQEMFDKADIVVMANWSSTNVTDERTGLDRDPAIPVIGVTTEWEPRLVFKGPKNLKDIALHHYKFEDEDDAFRPGHPQLVRIVKPIRREGMDFPGGGGFLLFLNKESDGRYAPVSGQSNPGITSVLMLSL